MRHFPRLALPLVAVLAAPLVLLSASPASALRPMVERSVTFSGLGGQGEWVVPAGVTEVRAELAAGAGIGSSGPQGSATGGAGGFVVAEVPVTPGDTLVFVLGASGATSGASAGAASTLGRAPSELLIVAGGGGGAGDCLWAIGGACGNGGAGGLSATAGDAVGDDAFGTSPGVGATPGAPGVSGSLSTLLIAATYESSTQPGTAPSTAQASVDAGVVFVPPITSPPFAGAGAGGSGFFAGGHGGASAFTDANNALISNSAGGGGGGSGYLDESVTLVEMRDSLGDGSLTLRWSEPAPPAITLSAGEVEQGDELTVSGTGFGSGEELRVVLNSDPIDLGGVIADSDGAFSEIVTVPADAPVGDHVITVGSTSAPLRVLAAAAAPGDPVDPGEPTDPAPSSPAPPASQPRLAESGAHTALPPMSAAALALLLAGALLVLRARRSPTRPRLN